MTEKNRKIVIDYNCKSIPYINKAEKKKINLREILIQ